MEGEQRQAEEERLEQGLKAMGEWKSLSEKNQKAMIASIEMAGNYLTEIMNLLKNEDPICAIEKDFEQLQSSVRTKRQYAKMIRGSPKAVVEIFNPQRFARFAVEIGGVYLLEQPLTSNSRLESTLQKIMAREDCILAQCDQCQYGLQDYHGGKMKKSTGWITNSQQVQPIEQEVRWNSCTHLHTLVLGSSGGRSRASQAQIYPKPLITAILEGYRDETQYKRQQPVTEPVQWMNMADCFQFEERLRQYESLWNWFVQEHHEEPHSIQALEEKEEKEDDEEKTEEGKKWLPRQPRERPFSTEQLVRRAHEGLGHPGNDRLARILQGAGASKKAVERAKNLTCSIRQKHQLVRPPRAAAPPKELPPNHTIGVDTIWLPTHGKKRRMALNIVCWAT